MTRRKYTIPAEMRAELETQAEGLARKLVEGGLHRDDAAEAIAAVFGAAAEAAVEAAGAPDLAGEIVHQMVERIALTITEALRPDPDKVLKRAAEALKAGRGKRARRLFAKAERLFGGGE